MRGADTTTESLFTTRKLEDPVAAQHQLREPRKMARVELAKLGLTLTATHSAEGKCRLPDIAPENLVSPMLLQARYSESSECDLMQQVQHNLLFLWCSKLDMDDAVWVPTVFGKSRERLIEHDAVIRHFHDVMAIAQQHNLLSGEYCSVDGTLIQALASPKSFLPKYSDHVGSGSTACIGEQFKGRRSRSETRVLKPDCGARLSRKGQTISELRCMGHTFSDHLHGLIANAMETKADGYV